MKVKCGYTFTATALMLIVLWLSGCQRGTPPLTELSGPIMGTTYHIKFYHSSNHSEEQKVQAAVVGAMQLVDSLMSTYKNSSEVTQFNHSEPGKWVSLSPETFEVVAKSMEIAKLSSGAFDVTVGPLVRSWGFGPDARPVRIPSNDAVTKMLQKTGYLKLSLDKERTSLKKEDYVELDLSAIAKGYAVDKVAEALEKFGISSYLVEIGGEIRASGKKANNADWILAIESPVDDMRQVWKKISIGNNALATSGDYRNYFEENGVRYSHTIDPKTGFPVQHKLTSVTVLRPASAEADAMATMFMVLGEQKGYELAVKNNIAAYFIYRNGNTFGVKLTKEFEPYLLN
ncbi:MAG: FAD:protein FMN transferase [Hahellaceae bacterium]|nr:FAD:protein FMN transferase [Hahellaceae bacterium]MCP5212102.1 FAD:protein FMN transferase [Hahellaceae bacterium]